jgi:DNA-binding CsgD family transcriptional regulator
LASVLQEAVIEFAPPPRRVAVAGPSRWASEGVAAALSAAWNASSNATSLARAVDVPSMEVRAFDSPAQLHAGSRWPEAVVALVASAAQRIEVERALPADLPVLWLVEPGAQRDLARSGTGTASRPCAWLHADSAPARWHAALGALAVGLSVYEPGLLPAPATDALAAPLDPLTPRELKVFELMAKGLPNRDIAAALGISPHTAKFHVAQILEKTATASRTEAVALGLRHGLVGL